MGNRMKEIREANKVKQKDLADILNITQATLSNWERAVHDPDSNSLKKIADYFNVTTDELLGMQKEKPTIDGELDKDTQYLIETYKELPEEYKKLLVAQAELLLRQRNQ